MKINKIEYPTPLSSIDDIYNGNIDVFVELEDNTSYTLVVCTPQSYYDYMDRQGIDYIPAAPPYVIVRKLTHETITRTIESFLEDNGYWLKVYHLAGVRRGVFELKRMDNMIEEIKQQNDELKR